MRSILLATISLALSGVLMGAAGDRLNLSGTWKIDPEHSESVQNHPNLTLLIEQNDQTIHIKETRGPNSKEDVSDFTCGLLGKSCDMKDGAEKASVNVYYNGPVLVALKTNGRKGDGVTKWRLSLAPSGDVLTVEVIHIDPQAKTEKLVFSKAQ